MAENTEKLRSRRATASKLDAFDRRILGALVEDAGTSYARLGEKVGLSAPAVHERVKRLREAGVITGTSARLDGAAIGRPLTAFVHLDTGGWGKGPELFEIARFPEVEELHSVAGDTGLILKIRTRTPQDLEALLHQLYAVPGVKGSKSFIVLTTYLERPVQAETTTEWPEVPRPG